LRQIVGDEIFVWSALPANLAQRKTAMGGERKFGRYEYMALRDRWTPPGAGLSVGRTHLPEDRRMQRSSRVDYDAIAPLYDSQSHPEKSPDPALAAFLAERSALGTAPLLDIACGTGNRLVANRAIAPRARMVGLDASLGMLHQARAKSGEIGWVHGDSSALPFASGMFDFASYQYALHHFRDKAGMVREAFRVLRTGGGLAIFNMCPHDSLDWLYYDYFPEALTRDLADFCRPKQLWRR
jgi:ubiquinone/menaquinone biosynthesis C-methylase UbiE